MPDPIVTGFAFTAKKENRNVTPPQTERSGVYGKTATSPGNSCTMQAFNCSLLEGKGLNEALKLICRGGYEGYDIDWDDTKKGYQIGNNPETFGAIYTIDCGEKYVKDGAFAYEAEVNQTNKADQALLVVGENPDDVEINKMKKHFDEHLQTDAANIMQVRPSDEAFNSAIDQLKAKVEVGGTITIALSAESNYQGSDLFDTKGNHLKDATMAAKIAELKKEGYNVCVIDAGCFGERRQETFFPK